MIGMSDSNRTWILKIVADIDDAKKGIQEVDKTTQGWGANAKKLGGAVAGALGTAAVIQFGKTVVNAASDTQQSLGAAQATFKDFSGEIEEFGKGAAKNLGISNQEFLQMSSLMGSLLSNAGVPLQQTTQMTKDLTQAAADLSAMYGGTAADAMAAMSSALKGEFDPLQNFAVTLKASTIEARAMADGYVDAEGKVTEAGKAIATQELILEQSANAAGTFARESGTLAGQTQIMQAQFKDLQATLGEKLLPVIVDIMEVLMPLIDFIAKNTDWLIPLAGAIGGVVLAVKAWTLAQGLLNIVLTANPIGLIIVAIAGLIALIVLCVTHVDELKEAFSKLGEAAKKAFEWVTEKAKQFWNWAKEHWPELAVILSGPFGFSAWYIWKHWDDVVSFFKDIPGRLQAAFVTVFDFLVYPFVRAAGYVVGAWNAVVDFFYRIPGYINEFFKGLFEILIYPFVRAAQAIMVAFHAVGDWFYRLPGVIRGYLSGLGDIITYPFRAAWGWIDSTFGGVLDWFYRLPGRIQGFFSQLADIILWPFRKAFEGIRWLWNSTLGGFGFSIPSWIPFGIGGKEFRIPKMATGGIVNRPTLALIGEAGPEAVVPLSQMGNMPGSNQPATIVNINVYALTANAEVGRKVYEALAEFERVSGRKFLTA